MAEAAYANLINTKLILYYIHCTYLYVKREDGEGDNPSLVPDLL